MEEKTPGSSMLSRLQRILTALGGADNRLLALAPVDRTEMTGRGIAALIPALFGGLAMIISFCFAFAVPLPGAIGVGLIWAMVVLFFDLSLMSAAPDRSLLSRLAIFGLRAVVSVLAALTFASAIVLFMFAKDISVQMAKDQHTDLAQYYDKVIVPAYAPKIATDNKTITADENKLSAAQQNVTNLSKQVANAKVQVTCEGNGVSKFAGCGNGTGRYGYGPVAAVRAAELANDQTALTNAKTQATALRAELQPAIDLAKGDLTKQSSNEKADYLAAQARYGQDNGLIARWRALSELERTSGTVRSQVWLLEGLIVVIDLSAVIAKMTSKTSSYNRMVEASRKQALKDALGLEEAAEDQAEMRRAERETTMYMHEALQEAKIDIYITDLSAWRQVRRWEIAAQANAAMGGEQQFVPPDESDRWPPSPFGGGRRNPTGDSRIETSDLNDLLKKGKPQENMPFRVDPSVTRAAWIGIGLLAALGLGLLLAGAAHMAVAGGWLVVLALGVSLVLAASSHAFRWGPKWIHLAAYQTALLGVAMPFLIVLINV